MSNLLGVALFFLFMLLVLPYPIYRFTRVSGGISEFWRVFLIVGGVCLALFSVVVLIMVLGAIAGVFYFGFLIFILIFALRRTKRHLTVFKHHFKDYQFLYDERDEVIARAVSWGNIGYSTGVDELDEVVHLYVSELFARGYILSVYREENPQIIIAKFSVLLKLVGVDLSYNLNSLAQEFSGKAALNCINSIAVTLRKHGLELIDFSEMSGANYCLAVVSADRLHEIKQFLIQD